MTSLNGLLDAFSSMVPAIVDFANSFKKAGESMNDLEHAAKFSVISGVALPEVADFAVTSMPSLSGGVIGDDPGYGYSYGGIVNTRTVNEIRQLKEDQRFQRLRSFPLLEKLPEIPVVSNRKRAVAVRKGLP